MRKWFTIVAIVLCFSLCLGITYAEEETTETAEPTDVIIDFSFCFTSVTDEDYARIETSLPKEELSYLRFKYIDMNGGEQEGEMIVNRHLAYDAIGILEEIYDCNLPIWDIQFFVGDGFDIAFIAPLTEDDPEEDSYNRIFGFYGFAWNENQANGVRHYTIDSKIPEWYPELISFGPL